MIDIDIPGYQKISIAHVVFDYNGTIAVDGCLMDGVEQGIRDHCRNLDFHVITADTFGFVKKELEGLPVSLTIIPKDDQAAAKKAYVESLGASHTLCAGNGNNDRLMLQTALVGVAVLQEEGLAVSSLTTADIVIRDILDLFGFFNTPERLAASLRT